MRVLFLCRDNSSRSQMAEALARQMFGADGEVEFASAGVEPGKLHPLAVSALREINIDIGTAAPKLITALDSPPFDLVVVICERDISAGVMPPATKKLHWPIMDPADPPAGDAELRQRFRDVRTALSKHLKGLGKLKVRPHAPKAS